MIIKVCGLKDPENILATDALHPDLLGFIFHPASPRYVSSGIPDSLALRTGVFVNASTAEILETAGKHQLHFLQLHGQETPEMCSELKKEGFQIIKAFSIGDQINMDDITPFTDSCSYILLDAKGKYAGGNGIRFNWDILSSYTADIPFLLSGGIRPSDIQEIKHINHPAFAGVDLNSGFETMPGYKNIQLLKQFIHDIRA